MNKEALIEYVLDTDNWSEPDQLCPFWTLWHDGDCLGPVQLAKLFSETSADNINAKPVGEE